MKKRRFLYLSIAFLLSIAPLAVYLGLNFQHYFGTVERSYGIGVFLAMIVVIYALKDKFSALFKNNGQMKISLFLLVVFWGVSKISSEVILLSFLSFCGSVLSLPFAIKAKREKRKTEESRQAEISVRAMQQVIAISKK